MLVHVYSVCVCVCTIAKTNVLQPPLDTIGLAQSPVPDFADVMRQSWRQPPLAPSPSSLPRPPPLLPLSLCQLHESQRVVRQLRSEESPAQVPRGRGVPVKLYEFPDGAVMVTV